MLSLLNCPLIDVLYPGMVWEMHDLFDPSASYNCFMEIRCRNNADKYFFKLDLKRFIKYTMLHHQHEFYILERYYKVEIDCIIIDKHVIECQFVLG